MTRNEAIAEITFTLPGLSDERLETLAEIARCWSAEAVPPEDQATRSAISRGLAEASRGEFATDAEVEAAFTRFRE